MLDFISEDDLETFEGWLKYQGIDKAASSPEDIGMWQQMFDEKEARKSTIAKVGLMKLRTTPGEHRYAVAVREGATLWLTLWVRRSPKGEFFVFMPRADRAWNPHASYHLDGTVHMKSYDRVGLKATKQQPLTRDFKGAVTLGAFFGHGPKGVGAICNPTDFSGVVEVSSGVLGPRDGGVTVDLVEPGCEPPAFAWTKIVRRQIFSDTVPHIIITVGMCG